MKDYLKENIRFIMKTEMLIGDGIAKTMPEQLKNKKWFKIGLVIDNGLYENNSYAREIVGMLQKELELVELLVCKMPEPTYDYLDEVKIQFKGKDLNCFVGIGGGSTMDLSKGLASLMTNDGPALSYRGFEMIENPPLPVVTIPTTAGSGSDVTPWAVFIDSEKKWKFGINTEYNYPHLSFYDPHFLDSCPDRIFASSGMDAMTHTLESFVAKNATSLSQIFSKKAFKLLFENLKKIAAGDRSPETKLNLLIGSACGALSLMNSGAGPAGALSYPLGVYFNVPHGLACSVFLPGVIKYNVKNGFNAYNELYDLVFEEKALSADEKSIIFADELKKLSDDLGIPTDLKGFGLKTDTDYKLIIDNIGPVKAAFDQNPVEFGETEIENLVFSLR